MFALAALLAIKLTNDAKLRTPKNEESQDYRNSDYFIVVAYNIYPEQAGGGHNPALCHDYDAVSPAVDSYFHNGLHSGACHSKLRVAGTSQALVAGRKAIVMTCAGPGTKTKYGLFGIRDKRCNCM
jgi:hypothetical protein